MAGMTDHPLGKPPIDAMELSPRRVRAVLGGVVVLDTTRARYLWEWPHYPQYYIPVDDVAPGVLVDGDGEVRFDRGVARRMDLRVGEALRRSAALLYTEEPLAGLVRFEWDALDAWFEEDEEVFFHPRDPYTRVDILPSSRHVRVEVDGVTVADSHSPHILFETGLPARYYLPKVDVRFDLLEHTDTATHCPYKGTAEYWTVNGRKDLAWSYRTPLPESERVAGLVAFYNEKLDIYLDGELQERPKTKFA